MGPGVVALRVVDVVGRDKRNPRGPRQLHQHGVDLGLLRQAVVLNLEVEPVRAQDVAVRGCYFAGLPVLAGQEEPCGFRGQAARQPDQPLGPLGQQLLVDARPVPEPLQVGVCHQPKEVPVAFLARHQERQVPVLLLALAGSPVEPLARRHVGLHPDDRPDAVAAGGLVEVERPEHGPVVGEGDRRHPESGRLGAQVFHPRGPVQERVLAVGVQVDEAVQRHRLRR